MFYNGGGRRKGTSLSYTSRLTAYFRRTQCLNIGIVSIINVIILYFIVFILMAWFLQKILSKQLKVQNMPLFYQNPVIHADYADPDVIRVGDNFWMVASSFNQVPGLPLLHSLNSFSYYRSILARPG
ncbi:family 43 glycosylhydrolase [Dickeya dadantii]|nr:family 43 glycosylhydrolase [Dickeya dadantii]QWT41947.1 family 43 glycosylhydrolase [Dickeya dadantii]